jgi:hypothetical protein
LLQPTPATGPSIRAITAGTLEALWKEENVKAHGTLSMYLDGVTPLPGLSFGIIRYPAAVGSFPLVVSPTISLWLQPRDQAYGATAAAGGMLSLEVAAPVAEYLEVFVASNAKTAGWVPLQPVLGTTANALAGVNVLVP